MNKLKLLYEQNQDQWLEETIRLLKNKQPDQLDIENLIQELEALGRRDKLILEQRSVRRKPY